MGAVGLKVRDREGLMLELLVAGIYKEIVADLGNRELTFLTSKDQEAYSIPQLPQFLPLS